MYVLQSVKLKERSEEATVAAAAATEELVGIELTQGKNTHF